MSKLELSGQKSDLYPKTRRLVNDAYEILRQEKLDPWRFFNVKPLDCTDCRGKRIHYAGVKFEGSPRVVFWGGYIDPFLETITIKTLDTVAQMCGSAGLNPAAYLEEASQLLNLLAHQVYRDMAKIDRVLRGEGYPNRIPIRDVSSEVAKMEKLVAEHLKATKALQTTTMPSISTPLEIDSLMEIASRRQMDLDLPGIYKRAVESGQPFAACMIDFDDLKKLNEKVGHPGADKVLHEVAQCVKRSLSGKGEVYRYAGDELLAILPNFTLEEALPVAERIRQQVELLSHAPLEVRSSITIGVSSYPEPNFDPQEVIITADKALLDGKSAGKNRVLSPMKSKLTCAPRSPLLASPPSLESQKSYSIEINQAHAYFKEVLGKGILTAGHWELLAYPCEYLGTRIGTLSSVAKMIQESTVKIGAWDFPYSDNAHTANFNSGRQSFTDWENHREGYRIYQSGLFTWARAFPEDIADNKTSSGNRPLNLILAIHLVTDFASFLGSLYERSQINTDIHVKIAMQGCKQRELAPFTAAISLRPGYLSAEDTIVFEEDLTVQQVKSSPLDYGLRWARHLFHVFNWNDVSDEFIERWQKRRD
jgi:diguanylate cyclase (GGDEF)-like protein